MSPLLSALDFLEEGVIILENNLVTTINKAARRMTGSNFTRGNGFLADLVNIAANLQSNEERTISSLANSVHVKFNKLQNAWCLVLEEVHIPKLFLNECVAGWI
jgi:nitrogen fixation/metabolism regulation signal transduction histidine kinase